MNSHSMRVRFAPDPEIRPYMGLESEGESDNDTKGPRARSLSATIRDLLTSNNIHENRDEAKKEKKKKKQKQKKDISELVLNVTPMDWAAAERRFVEAQRQNQK